MSLFKTPSLWPLIFVLACTRWTTVAQITRAQVASLKTRDFVKVSKGFGASPLRVLLRTVVPHTLKPALVSATFSLASTLLLESSLSFLGLGVAAPAPSWGELLSQAQRNMVQGHAWWLAVFPGLAMTAVVLAFQSVGRSFERQLDDTV
jgi:peptide/nickel transport system permease protein